MHLHIGVWIFFGQLESCILLLHLEVGIFVVLLPRFFVELLAYVCGRDGFCLFIELNELVSDIPPDEDRELRTGIFEVCDEDLLLIWKRSANHASALLEIEGVLLCCFCLSHHHDATVTLLKNLLNALLVPFMEGLEAADEDSCLHRKQILIDNGGDCKFPLYGHHVGKTHTFFGLHI